MARKVIPNQSMSNLNRDNAFAQHQMRDENTFFTWMKNGDIVMEKKDDPGAKAIVRRNVWPYQPERFLRIIAEEGHELDEQRQIGLYKFLYESKVRAGRNGKK